MGGSLPGLAGRCWSDVCPRGWSSVPAFLPWCGDGLNKTLAYLESDVLLVMLTLFAQGMHSE